MFSRFFLLFMYLIHSFTGFGNETVKNDLSNSKTDTIEWRKNNIKVNIFPMLGARLNLAWETGTKRFPALEFSIEGIGIFTSNEEIPKGFMAQLGHRFYSKLRSEELQHPNSGFFFMPAFKAGYTQYIGDIFVSDNMGNSTLLKRNINKNYFIPNLNVGIKYVLYNRFSLEMQAGVGILISSQSDEVLRETYTPNKDPFKFGFYQFSNDLPIIGSATVRLGYLFR